MLGRGVDILAVVLWRLLEHVIPLVFLKLHLFAVFKGFWRTKEKNGGVYLFKKWGLIISSLSGSFGKKVYPPWFLNV